MRKAKIAVITLFTVVMLGISGLIIYEFIDTGSISRDTIVRASLIIVAGIIALIKAFNNIGGTVPYQKYEAAYAKELEKTFVGESNKRNRKELLNAAHLFNLKAYNRAIVSLEKLLKKCQTSGDVYGVKLFMALSYEGLRSGYKAMEIYKEMIKQGTYRATPYINLGVLYDNDDNGMEAIKCFKEAVRLDPTDYHSYNNLAQVYTRNDMFNEAIECANKLLELKSNFADGYEILAICYNALGDYENAEKYFTKSIKNGISEQKIRRAMDVYKDTGISNYTEDTDNTETEEN